MIRITENIWLDEKEIHEDFVRAGGPGGQHVNKTATAVQLRFNAATSPSLPDDVRERLGRLAGKKLTEEGVLLIRANRYREQHRNREDAMERLISLLRRATEKPTPRKNSRPSAAAKRRRLEDKRRQSARKKHRGAVSRPNSDDF